MWYRVLASAELGTVGGKPSMIRHASRFIISNDFHM